MPGIKELINSLHEKGYHYLETALEDKRSIKSIGNGAFKGLIVKAVIEDLSEYGLFSLDRYIAETTKKDGKYFDTLLVTLQDMHVFTDEDLRFKEEFRQVYARIYASSCKKTDLDLQEHHLQQEREMLLTRAQQARS